MNGNDALPVSGAQHTLAAHGYTATIASVGATLRSLQHEGRHLIVPFEADELRPAYRGATLAPWPNRVIDGRYVFDGVEHQLPLTEPARGHALHGLLAWARFEAVDPSPDRLALAAVVEPQDGYPWRVRVQVDYALGPEGLTQTVTGTNLSARPAPFGVSAHPYLLGGSGPLDGWDLVLPARHVMLTETERLLPAETVGVDEDAERFDFRSARRIGAVEIDHAYTGLLVDAEGRCTASVTDAEGRGAAVSWGSDCPWVQVHTADMPGRPGHRIGLAVEPMTCPPDAFNSGDDLIVLQPGASASASWTIAAVGPVAA